MRKKPTCDPDVFIEEQGVGYVRYGNIKDGRRWEVFGICTQSGKCWEGAVNEKPILDCPVSPDFQNDCCPLVIKKLN